MDPTKEGDGVDVPGAGDETLEQAEEALPELELRQLMRSEKPINQEDRNTKKIGALKSWANYTILILENPSKIRLFDENGIEIEDFRQPLNRVDATIDYAQITADSGKSRLGTNRIATGDTLKIQDLPPLLQKRAERALQGATSREAWRIKEESLSLGNPDVKVLEGGKYIVVGNKNEGPFIAFITENQAGIVQAPRNWTRVGLTSPDIPSDLIEYIKTLESLTGEYRDISNDEYAVLVTYTEIKIVGKERLDEKPLFSDNIPGVEQNIVSDPANPDVIFYCRSNNPKDILKLDLSADPGTWSPVSAEFPKQYTRVSNLQLDPSGNFFLFYSDQDLVILTKDTLEEVKRVPGLTEVNFDASGRIRAVDKDGHLVIYEPNFDELARETDKRRVAKLAQGFQLRDIFDPQVSREDQPSAETLEHLQPLREQYRHQFDEVLGEIVTQEGVQLVRQKFNTLRNTFSQQGFKPNEVGYIIEGLEALILEKEKEFAVKETRESLASVQAALAGGLSITSISEARAAIEKVRPTEALLEADLRQEFRQTAQELEQKSLEFFHQRGSEVVKYVEGLVARTKTDLEGFTSKMQMDDWLEFRYPQIKFRLGSILRDIPLEADEANKAVTSARSELQELASRFEEEFTRQYAKVREKAAQRIEASVNMLEVDIEGLISRLRSREFADRPAAEQYLSSSDAFGTLKTEITALEASNPDVAKELKRALKVRVSNALTEIERGGMTQVAETGQQMVLFGETYFPKWEAKVKEKVARKAEIAFDIDPKTHGPGVSADKILGDVAVNIRTSTGETKKARLYEGWQDENQWRLGLLTYRGEVIPPSYVTAEDFRKIRGDYSDWSQGKKSSLQIGLQEKKDALKEIYSRRQKPRERTEDVDEAWKQEYQKSLAEYAEFVATHHIVLLKRIDHIRSEPEAEYTNGKGFVPEWQSHWVNDPQTDRDLEEMAKALKMQLDLQEGILNLKGHAGTGKDVRLKMFCALTNRPYFGIDCTKWMTEFELSEDVMLESKDGASQTIKVPSAVLNGITTPGAVVYFNEFNAMPEQAQIFLHALMDEKRSLTLKTSSGKVIRALPSVLLLSSMNPGYPGTFDPQFATKSRMVSIEIGYPPLIRKPEAGDTNPNPPYDVSEALRVARGVDSLSDLTYEASLEHNDFAKMWDKYVNGIENGAPDPVGTQRFDIDTILALVEFANNLREEFIKIYEKNREARNALPVSQPITGRELRRCAYALSKMTPEEKATANPEAVARGLLDKYFLTHIDKKEDQEKIRTAIGTWTSKKRVRA